MSYLSRLKILLITLIIIGPMFVFNSSLAQPLFEVNDLSGITIFAVYADGIKVFDSNGDSLMTVVSDSIRFYLREPSDSRGVARSFSMGTSSSARNAYEEYVTVSPEDAVNSTINGKPMVLWYPLKEAFRVGNVLITSPDSVGTNSMASGYQSKAIGNYSQALGYQCKAYGDYSIAIGKDAIAGSGTVIRGNDNCFAFGNTAKAVGINSLAIGEFAYAHGENAYAFGEGVEAGGLNSYAMGHNARAANWGAFAFGDSAQATAQSSYALGSKVLASGNFATALGNETNADGQSSLSFGKQTVAGGDNSLAGGHMSQAMGAHSIALGDSVYATEANSVALGKHTVASAPSAVAFGIASEASGNQAIAMGDHTEASGENSFAMGHLSVAEGQDALAMGNNAQAIGTNSVAIGAYVKAGSELSHLNSMVIGCGAISPPAPEQYLVNSTNNSLMIGFQSDLPTLFVGPAQGIGTIGRVGIGTAMTPNILTVVQNSQTNPIADAWSTYNSARWMANVQTIRNALNRIMQLRGVDYTRIENNEPDIGLVAEEVGQIIPHAVTYEVNGTDARSLDYGRLVALLVEGIKEQQELIEHQDEQNAILESRLTRLESELGEIKAMLE